MRGIAKWLAVVGIVCVAAGTVLAQGTPNPKFNKVTARQVTLYGNDPLVVSGTSMFSSGKIDGEQIAADTIDDDSIDFSDVTGADLTLTDCGAISGTTLTSTKDIVTPTAVTATNGYAFPATVSIYNATAASCMTCTVANASVKGQYLEICLLVGGTNTMTFADSGNLKLTAAFAMGDDDVLAMRSYDGTNWFEVGRNAN